MKQIKNINIKLSKNTIIFLVLLLILIFCYLEYNKKILEGYLLPNCTINHNIDGPKTSDFVSNNVGSKSFKCKSGNKPVFYYDSSIGDIYSQYFIDVSHNTSNHCANMASDISYDFYVLNNNKCVYYDLSSTVYNKYYNPDVSTLLYVSCSGDVGPKFYTKLGKGEFSQSGFIKIKDTNFNYLAYANNACAIDYSLQNTQNNLQSCLDTANNMPGVATSLRGISRCFNTYGNNIIDYVSGDYGLLNNGQFYKNEPINEDITDSTYINSYYDSVKNNSLTDRKYESILHNNVTSVSGGLLYSDNSLNYDNTLNKVNETNLEYKSTYLRNLFVIIVLILTIILLLISVISPDIISVEILTVYVLFILLLVFFGTKYFNIFESDLSSWKYSFNNWFQKNILNN
tara:strand:+ start:6092 stop:7291 length:1200 start_codon:yes stop_codon:yes gene_type:complete